MDEADADVRARRAHAEDLRRAIDEATEERPGSPREFTDRAAREAREDERQDP